MKKIRIKGVEEDIFYEKLDNGLEVYLYAKDTVHSNYVTFTTKYGSVYNEFVPINSDKMTTFPKGIAHFLEHKVFAQKEDPQPCLYNIQKYNIFILCHRVIKRKYRIFIRLCSKYLSN